VRALGTGAGSETSKSGDARVEIDGEGSEIRSEADGQRAKVYA